MTNIIYGEGGLFEAGLAVENLHLGGIFAFLLQSKRKWLAAA